MQPFMTVVFAYNLKRANAYRAARLDVSRDGIRNYLPAKLYGGELPLAVLGHRVGSCQPASWERPALQSAAAALPSSMVVSCPARAAAPLELQLRLLSTVAVTPERRDMCLALSHFTPFCHSGGRTAAWALQERKMHR